MDAETSALSESLVDEMVTALGLPKTAFWHSLFWRVSRGVTGRLATLGVTFDRLVDTDGLPKASEWMLTDFCHPIPARGAENIPLTGPLLVVSNHPGAYDGLVIFSKLVRKDIRWIGTEIPFLEKLPHVRERILFASRTDAANRMAVMRAAIRHLRSGGALVYFGAGHRDPDPAVYPDAGKMMDDWLEGIDFFFRHVPDLRLLPAVVSGVVSEKWARHPVTLLRRKQIDKQRLSEFGQVITQLLFPRKLMLSPRLSFGASVTGSELRGETSGGSLLPAVIAREKSLLAEHCQSFGGDPGL
ncbi:MAG: phospholipid/glycerol acyltransferase [Anaerolineaceae bacterium]|nr:MAG: phospholipid/glycerol acyltransferase [Anaerolineaceae bacterium]